MPGKPTLRFGYQGSAVKELQAALNTVAAFLTPALKEDGIFGQKTFTRVKDVQQLGHLTPDGVVGPLTWELIASVLSGALGLAGAAAQQAGVPLPEVNPLRNAIAKAAWDEWMYHGAHVHAKYPGGVDPIRKKTYRQGHDRLMMYFCASAPAPGNPGSTYYGNDNVTYLPSWFGQKPGDTLKSWCGIFALWAVKSAAGLYSVGNWKDGFGIASVVGIIPTKTPRRGDIAYREDHQHHGVVFDVVQGAQGTQVISIDGNSAPGSSVTRNEASIKKWQSFYRVALVGP